MTVGPQVDDFLGDHFEDAFPDLFDDLRVSLTAQVAGGVGNEGVECSFEADLPMIRSALVTRLLAGGFDQVVGDLAHRQCLAGRLRGFDSQPFHLQGGLHVAQSHLDIPAPGVDGGEFLPVVFLRVR